MRPKLFLLSISFIAFYLFTDLNWQIGAYLGGREMYSFLRSTRGQISEASTLFSFLLMAMTGYLHFYWLFYRQPKKVLAVFSFLLLAVPLMILSRYLIQEVIVYTLTGYHNYGAVMRRPARYFMDNIYFSMYYSAFGLVFFFIQLAGYQQKRQAELLVQNRQAELSFLRAQINPHFLFNSLNNVYTMVYQHSANALPAISKLSGLMRYLIYEKEEWVPLQKEVQYLQDLIGLQLLRYDFEPSTNISLQVPDDHILIAPLTLVPFVENAFKHGDLKDPQQPLTINLYVRESCLHFHVANKKSNLNKDESGGVGLANVQKRLDLIYGRQHELAISDNATDFTIKLTINLKDDRG